MTIDFEVQGASGRSPPMTMQVSFKPMTIQPGSTVRSLLARILGILQSFWAWITAAVPGVDTRARGWGRAARVLVRVTISLTAASILSVVVLRWVPPVTTSFILRERLFGPYPVDQGWTPWDEISPHVALAVVASEDQKFPYHSGFDVEEIAKALSDNVRRRGASTISQQVAKNLYLWPGGGFPRKGIEAYLTVLIETAWPKRRILEVYLNVAEFGPGVFGVGVAADRYFGKAPADLNPNEAARLAAVLPSPKRMSAAAPSGYVVGRSDVIRREMRRLGPSYLDAIWGRR